VKRRDPWVLDDEVASSRVAPDEQMSRRRLELAARHQHEPDGRVRERNLRLADVEGRLQVERHGLPRRDGPPAARRGALPVVDEDELPIALVDDARVLRRDAGHRQHDVGICAAAYEDRLLSEAGDHSAVVESMCDSSSSKGHHAPR
jgi:hypothetical protein